MSEIFYLRVSKFIFLILAYNFNPLYHYSTDPKYFHTKWLFHYTLEYNLNALRYTYLLYYRTHYYFTFKT